MRKQSGFTLVELMIAAVIVAILASVALPAYNDYLIRARIPDATSILAQKRIQMEQYFQDNRSYSGAPACAADSASSTQFDFSCASTDTTFTLQATGKAQMEGFAYSINERNAKQTSISYSGWSNPSPNNCWAVRKDGGC